MKSVALSLLLVHCASVAPSSQPVLSIVSVDQTLTGARCSADAARIIADNHAQDIAAWESALIKCDAREQNALAKSNAAMRALDARSFWADYGVIVAIGGAVVSSVIGLSLGYTLGRR